MKTEVSREINRYDSIDGETHLTPENLPKEKSEFEPEQGSVEVDGIHGGGFRVKWNYSLGAKETGKAGAVVEELNAAGEWVVMGGIQKLTIEFDVDSYIPKVKMERIII